MIIWTPEMDQQLRKLWKQGLLWREIGATMGLTDHNVRRRAHKVLNIPTVESNGPKVRQVVVEVAEPPEPVVRVDGALPPGHPICLEILRGLTPSLELL